MFNLTEILAYLRASITITNDDDPRDPTGAVVKDPAAKFETLILIAVTALIFFHAIERRQLRERDQRQQARLAALEMDMLDIEGRLLPRTGRPALLEDDDDDDGDFKLPPPAYELHVSMPVG